MGSGKDKNKDQGMTTTWLLGLVFLAIVVGPSVVSGAESGLLPPPKQGGNKPAQKAEAPAAKCKGSDRACLLRYKRNGRLLLTTGAGCDTPRDFRNYRSIDSRVWKTAREMIERTGGIRISCLKSGHSTYTNSGNFSAHPYGRAMDVDMVKKRGGGWVKINPTMQRGYGNGLMLTLSDVCMDNYARQTISLLKPPDRPGRETLALSDHSGHIHCGW